MKKLKITRSRLFIFFLILSFLLIAGILLITIGKERTIVDMHGQLQVKNTQIVNEKGEAVALHGMSLFWSQWDSKYYNYDCIKWLRDDWNCQVIRIAMATGKNGYADFPEREMKKVTKVIDACIDLGIYVLVDWHSHNAEEQVNDAY